MDNDDVYPCLIWNQSALVPGLNIVGNILVTFEVINFIKRKNTGQDGEVAPKLDVNNYDRVDWHYLRHRMRQKGFSENKLSGL